jgi:hypothetical protein
MKMVMGGQSDHMLHDVKIHDEIMTQQHKLLELHLITVNLLLTVGSGMMDDHMLIFYLHEIIEAVHDS